MCARRFRGTVSGLLLFVFLTVLAAQVTICQAQEYPNRAIDLVVPFAAGGGADTFFRQIREALAKELKVPTNVVNRPGGGGVVGASFVANSRPDGYTLLGCEYITHLMSQVITPKTVPHHVLKSFTPVAHCAFEPLLIVIRPDLEPRTIEELISYAKKNPEKLLAGTSGIGTQNRTNLEILKNAAGINIRHLLCPGGGGEVMIKLLGGHIDMTFATVTVSRPQLRAGKLRALAVLGSERVPDFPDVPTTKEKGLPEVNINMAYGLLGPKGLPTEIVEKLAQTTSAVIKSPEVLSNLKRNGYLPEFMGPNPFNEFLAKSFDYYTEIAKKAELVQN